MLVRFRPIAAAIAVAFSSSALAQTATASGQETILDNVSVSGARIQTSEPEANTVSNARITALRAASSDTAHLLRDIPGLSLSGAGGVSSLPVVHGLADDRIRIKVDGMDLISACANHMNSPLSYIDPTNVEQIKVFAGIAPVSVGGDSIGGSIIVKSGEPRFAQAGEGLMTSGEIGGFYRSNGNAQGANLSATLATESLSIRYNGAAAQSDNYKSARDFKPGILATGTRTGNHWIDGNEVASSAYKTENHALGIAYKQDQHLLDLRLGYQHIPYQGFPNQHMDMTGNESSQVNLGYTGRYDWGKLEARTYHEETRHQMDFADDKYFYTLGMPMTTRGKNTGALLKAEIDLSERDLLRIGGEYQQYRLDDWWPPVGTGMMAPDTFRNINNGQRDRFDIFGEWEARWSAQWLTLIGARYGRVEMDSGTIQGYRNNTPGSATYDNDRNTFNARNRQRSDNNIDLTLLTRFTPDTTQSYEGGYARKTRSPNLYERYTWSTGGMAMTMNNWVNDGNGYVGNIDLKPEVAHTLSVTAGWHDTNRSQWGVKLTPYYTRVDNYIDATCASNKPSNVCRAGQYNYLSLVNQDARLYGLDLSGFAALGRLDGVGDFMARGTLAYVDGKNRTTGDNLYNIMPLNARLLLEHRQGNWTNTLEEVLVSDKNDVSSVRSEIKTAGYGLLNLRSSYTRKNARFDIGLDNALDKHYASPLGGAYIGQGMTMSIGSSTGWSATTRPPYGTAVPGMGRSLYAGVSLMF